nr:hypothetical protein GCM10020093_020490 [Planobispora longispora]
MELQVQRLRHGRRLRHPGPPRHRSLDQGHLVGPAATTTEDAVTNRASYGAPNCKEEWLWWSIEGIVADWANGAANHGLQMRAANENDTTNWRMFHSAEFAGGNRPTLVVKYEDQGIVAPAGPDGVEVFRGNGEDVPQMSDTLSAALDKAIDAAEANPADLAQPYADAETGQLITPAVTTAGQTLAAKTLSGQAATGEGSDDPTVPGAVEASEEGDAAETPDTSAGTTVSYSIASAVANAKYSAGALQAIADEIAGLDATQLPGADAIYITGVQPERNRVVVQATSASVETRQALAARYGLDKVAIRLIDPGQVPVKTESRNNDIGDYIAGGRRQPVHDRVRLDGRHDSGHVGRRPLLRHQHHRSGPGRLRHLRSQRHREAARTTEIPR